MNLKKISLKERFIEWQKRRKGLIIDVKASEFIQDQLSIIDLFNRMPASIEETVEGPFTVTQRVNLSKAAVPVGLVNQRWTANFGRFEIPGKSIALAGDSKAVIDDISAMQKAEADAMAKRQAAYEAFKALASNCMTDLKKAKSYDDYLAVLNRMDQASVEHIRGYVNINFDQALGESVFLSAWRIGSYLSVRTQLSATKNLGNQLQQAAEKYISNRKGVILAKEVRVDELLSIMDYAKVKTAN